MSERTPHNREFNEELPQLFYIDADGTKRTLTVQDNLVDKAGVPSIQIDDDTYYPLQLDTSAKSSETSPLIDADYETDLPAADEELTIPMPPQYGGGEGSRPPDAPAVESRRRFGTKSKVAVAVLALAGINYAGNAYDTWDHTDGEVIVNPIEHFVDMTQLIKESIKE